MCALQSEVLGSNPGKGKNRRNNKKRLNIVFICYQKSFARANILITFLKKKKTLDSIIFYFILLLKN